jgi:hypothetical protein
MKYFLAALMSGPASGPRLPIFLIAAFVFLALGVVHSPLWLLGTLGVLGVVAALSSQERFRKVVDSRRFDTSTPVADDYESLASQIKIETRSRLKILERKRERILEQQRGGGTNEYVLDSNRDALQQLLRIFAKLLITRQQLLTEDFAASTEKTHREIEGIQNEINATSTSGVQRDSLNATLQLQRERLRSLDERSLKVQEIESDLKRIEAHFELALSQASTRDKPQGITTDIGLVTQGLHEATLSSSTASESETITGGETTTSTQQPIAQ